MALDKDKQIDELYYLKHRHDNLPYRHYPWENEMLERTTTPYMWRNPEMNEYLERVQEPVSLMVEMMNVARNYFNPTVDKYYNDHWG